MKVQSSAVEIKPIEILQDKVYIRKNITWVDQEGDEGFHGWEYDEIVLSLEQYLSAIETIGQQVTNLMLEVL
ncbi:MAG: hypothetical protein QM236_06030 [Bacillota bacterium]|nr:hypothetical protein [Bacillota bacterium]